MVQPPFFPFSSLLPFLPLPPPSIHLQPHPTPSAHSLLPPCQLQGILMQPCYVHCWTTLRLMLDLLLPFPSLTPSDPVHSPSDSSVPTLKHTHATTLHPLLD